MRGKFWAWRARVILLSDVPTTKSKQIPIRLVNWSIKEGRRLETQLGENGVSRISNVLNPRFFDA